MTEKCTGASAADDALGGQLAQPIDGVGDVDVAREAAAVVVDGDVAHDDVGGR